MRGGLNMARLPLILIVALALWIPAIRPAAAGCIQFEETNSGEASLFNTCGTSVNVAYSVSRRSSTTDTGSFVRLPMAPDSRAKLWAPGHAPLTGEYRIKIYGCDAPTVFVYLRGGRPTCQLNAADAG